MLADEQGAQAPGFLFRNECQKPSPWQAKWIWTGQRSSAPVAMFRKEITLDEMPKQVAAWLTADAKYRLYVNGRLASRGPVDIGRDFAGGQTHRWFYDTRDLTPLFVKGKNVIAAEVFRHGGGAVSRGRPGLLFEAEITLPGRDKLIVKSDATWRATAASQFPDPATYDAGREPAGWRLPDFDDTAWPKCDEVQDVWEPLVASEIPPLMEVRYPVLRVEGLPSRTLTADGSFRVVFDRVLSAYPTIKVKGGKGARADDQGASASQDAPGRRRAVFRVSLHDRDRAGVHRRSEERHRAAGNRGRRRELHLATGRVPRHVRVQRRAVEPHLEGVALGRANLPADASSRFAEPPGADQRSGRLPDRVDGEPLRLRPAVAGAAGRAEVRLAAERRELPQLPHQLLDRLVADADGLLRLHRRQDARRGNGAVRP